MPRAINKNIIAIVYDFDGTLCQKPMQEYTVFPHLRITPGNFWKKVRKENQKIKGEEIITYMMLMLKMADAAELNTSKKLRISKQDLGKMAKKIKYFKGVKSFFRRINNYVAKESRNHMTVRHYIISSGLKEILMKASIKKYFKNIFASEYYYDTYRAPKFPKLVVTDTVKTQFLFRINKGKEKITESINDFMPEDKRPIPFNQIIYIGDGMTDVPCMTVTRKNGGCAIAVYEANSRRGKSKCKRLLENARVDLIAEADYTVNSNLDKSLKTILRQIIQSRLFEMDVKKILLSQGIR